MTTLTKTDSSLACFGYSIVSPIGRFKHRGNLRAVPKRYRVFQFEPAVFRKEWAESKVEEYNRRAIQKGWKLWAVVGVSPATRDFLQRAEAASATFDDGSRLTVAGLPGYQDTEPKRLSVTLCLALTLGDEESEADLRELARKLLKAGLQKIESHGMMGADDAVSSHVFPNMEGKSHE